MKSDLKSIGRRALVFGSLMSVIISTAFVINNMSFIPSYDKSFIVAAYILICVLFYQAMRVNPKPGINFRLMMGITTAFIASAFTGLFFYIYASFINPAFTIETIAWVKSLLLKEQQLTTTTAISVELWAWRIAKGWSLILSSTGMICLAVRRVQEKVSKNEEWNFEEI